MSENEIRNKRLNVLASFIEEVLIGHRMNDMSDLETEEPAAQTRTQTRERIENINAKTNDNKIACSISSIKSGNNS